MYNLKELKLALEDIFSVGPDSVHVLADFDGTLTKEYIDGKKIPSLISVLRDHPGYLSAEYQAKAHELYAQYSPLEKDTQLGLSDRKDKMLEWWTRHKKLLIDSGLKRQHLEDLSRSDFIQWRDGAVEFLKLMSKAKIPVVIMSASGIGEVVPMFCKARGIDFENMHYIVNSFVWAENGSAIDWQRPIIHSLNKDETIVKDHKDIYKIVSHRRKVLLLGNNTGDLGMIKGFETDKLLSFGFLDKEETALETEYKKYFDQVVISDDFVGINKVLSEFIK